MRYFIFICALFFIVPALAKDNMIRIIKEDGTVVEVEIGRPPEARPAPAPAPAPEPVSEPEPAPIEEFIEPPPPAPDPWIMPEPVKDDVVKPEAAPPEKEEAAEEMGPTQPTIPIPPRKPAVAKYTVPEAYAPSRSDITPGKTAITKDVALAIALENDAPPARSVKVLPRMHDGWPVFVVQFRTENGLYEILVDRENGDIIEP